MAGCIERRILVVDDDENNRIFCADALAASGYAVDTAFDGVSALELLSLSNYNLVLTDINMPRLDGIGFYNRAVTKYPALNDFFLFMTAGGYPRDICETVKGFSRKCVYKPFTITELTGCVDSLLVRHTGAVHVKNTDEKRHEPRFECLTDCEVFDKKMVNMNILLATAREVSSKGLRIRYLGEPLKPGTEVSVYARINQADILRGARVVWSREDVSVRSVSGLRFMVPMPMSSIAGVTLAEESLAS